MLRAVSGVFAHAGKGVGLANVARAREEVGALVAAAGDEGTRGAASLALAHIATWLTEVRGPRGRKQGGKVWGGVGDVAFHGWTRAIGAVTLRVDRPIGAWVGLKLCMRRLIFGGEPAWSSKASPDSCKLSLPSCKPTLPTCRAPTSSFRTLVGCQPTPVCRVYLCP